ncbi:MAG TPA: Verru_Chthon cassette protein A [Terrimicrobiaceae bacterium]|nr:Verru_Chthon cassette protein A [Terrimicrobiaceae bacterium]
MPTPAFRSHSARRRGAALIIVLSILVILILLVVGMLSRITTERTAASAYASNVATRNLADIAVNLVQGQINEASTQGIDYAWASQPGMVRTYDAAGSLFRAYKLYSAPDMVSSAVSLTADVPPSGWRAQSGGWTDLNEPVQSADGLRLSYPILDPAAIAAIEDISPVEGLSLTAPPGYNSGQSASPANNPAPMPVRWLYVLRDGQLTLPSAVSGATADFSASAIQPSKDNPIVGRVAFWTDDDTAKININTAGEGTFWDVPRANSTDDRDLGQYQPVRGEWQRYPGHPATTSLSPAFRWNSVNPGSKTAVQRIMDLVPRYAYGGSEAGTVLIPTTGYTMPSKSYPLYASDSELAFTTPSRLQRTFNLSSAENARKLVESRRFVLTAHSRAPEVNLFNLPRIAIWPIYRLTDSGGLVTSRVTEFDRAIARCATINGKPYFFQRELADSPTNDLAQINRNLELYAYLQDLTNRDVPGFGGRFSTKYGADRDQILTEIFDYVRSTNLYDDLLAAGNQFTDNRAVTYTVVSGHGSVTPIEHPNGTRGFGRFPALSEFGLLFIATGQADDPATSGSDESQGSNDVAANKTLKNVALNAGETRIQAMAVFELSAASLGYAQFSPDMQIRIEGLHSLTAGGQSLQFPANATISYSRPLNNITGGASAGGAVSFRLAYRDKAEKPPFSGERYPLVSEPVTIPTAGPLSLGGGLVKITLLAKSAGTYVPVQTVEIDFPGGSLPVPKLVTAGTSAGTSTQKEDWWAFKEDQNFTKPNVHSRLFYGVQDGLHDPGTVANPASGAMIRDGFDVVRTVQPLHGDYRLIAAGPKTVNSSTPGGEFQENNGIWNSGTVLAWHTLTDGMGPGRTPGFDGTGKLADNAAYSISSQPNVPNVPSSFAKPWETGDWDSGIGLLPDGAYINKPDEGNSWRDGGVTRIPYFHQPGRQESGGPTFFSPNRIIPSPGMLGSLSTGILAGKPWQTLLFRPQSTHPGAASPKDHLLLDLFWMPVVEPYVISEPFSTAGKVNLNFQILPFTYIERSTGMRAVLAGEKIGAIPVSSAATYKGDMINQAATTQSTASLTQSIRRSIDAEATLQQFRDTFAAGKIFLSATEICDQHIVPVGTTLAAMQDTSSAGFWAQNALTGENIRERIYTTIYPRITTKSNTFTVFTKVQNIQKSASSDPLVFEEGKDKITGEYRGATVLERYIDPNNAEIPDYAANITSLSSLQPLDRFYRWRVIQNRQFLP